MRINIRLLLTAVVAALVSVLGLSLVTASSASASIHQYQMDPGDSLSDGQGLWSADGQFVGHMDGDGHFEVWVASGDKYATIGTSGYPDSIIKMQDDGNLVIIAPGNVPIWSSGTDGHPGTVLQLQNDGALVLYAPGHVALKVIVPRLFDADNSVATPRLEPYPTGDPASNEIGEMAVEGGKAVFCSSAGKAVEVSGKVPHGKIAGIAADKACGAAAKGEVPRSMDGYDATVLVGSIALGPFGPAFEIFFGDPPSAN